MSFPGGVPNEFYRFAFKQGDSGWDVTPLQIALNDLAYGLVVDGSFGPATDKAVRDYQTKHTWLAVDGVAGLMTQMAMCVGISSATEKKYILPGWLLKGIMEGESGFALAAVSRSYGDGSRDYGVYQDNLQVSEQTDALMRRAFSVHALAEDTAKKIREQKDIYTQRINSLSSARRVTLLKLINAVSVNQAAWWCAILYHNWPAAAEQYSSGTISTWLFTDSDGSRKSMDQAALWVKAASGGRLQTGSQWASEYVRTKTLYVASYPA